MKIHSHIAVRSAFTPIISSLFRRPADCREQGGSASTPDTLLSLKAKGRPFTLIELLVSATC